MKDSISVLKAEAKKGFSMLSGINRPIIPSHVTKMASSIEKMGVIRPVVVAVISFITGKKQTYVIDGQHLLHGLLRLKMDIPYVIIEVKDKTDLVEKIALLNSSSKSWCLQDYVTAWGSLIDDYVRLNKYFNIYDCEFSVIAEILSGNVPKGANGGSSISNKIKRGEFRIVDEEQNLLIIDQLTDVLKFVNRQNRVENRYVCSEYVAFVRSCPNYNHDKFIANLQANKDRFVLATQEVGKLNQLFKKLS